MKIKRYSGLQLLLCITLLFPIGSINAQLDEEDFEQIEKKYPFPAETPAELIDRAIAFMPMGYYYDEESEEWQEQLAIVQEQKEKIKTKQEAVDLLEPLMKLAGGKHSWVQYTQKDYLHTDQTPETNGADSKQEFEDNELPSFSYDNQVLNLVVPTLITKYIGDKRNDTYVDALLEAFKFADIKGITIDLRDNYGGQWLNMQLGLLPLFPEGKLDAIVNKQGEEFWTYSLANGLSIGDMTYFVEHEKVKDIPIAILINNNTASAAEQILMDFMGLDPVRTFGQPTAGYNSATWGAPLDHEYRLTLASAMMQARDGSIFYEEPIQPDVVTDQPMEEALKWLESEMNK